MTRKKEYEWFGRENVFNTETEQSWITNPEKIAFPNKTWQEYVDSRRLEITCGEAPYLCSRYDAASGEISYILGFSDEISIDKHNFKQLDALQYAKEGTLEKKLDEIFK